MQTSWQKLSFLCLILITKSRSIMVEYKEPVYGDNGSEMSPLVVEASAPSETTSQVDVLSAQVVESNETTTTTEHDRMVGAGVASGVVGLLIGGPFFGMLLGFGAAWAADKEGAAGDTSRAIGEVALVAKSKAKEVDAKHNLVLRSKAAASHAWERAKEVDRKHNVLEKTKQFVVFSWEKMLEINREHRVLERSIEAIGRALGYAVTQISEKLRQNDAGGRDSPDSWTQVPTASVEEEEEQQPKK